MPFARWLGAAVGAWLALGVVACGLGRSGSQPAGGTVGGEGGDGAAPMTGPSGPGGAGGTPPSDGGSGAVGGSGGRPACTAEECVELPVGASLVTRPDVNGACPSGWETPVTVYPGTDPGCETCGCEAPAGTCSVAGVAYYPNSDCSGSKTVVGTIATGQCANTASRAC